MRNADERLTVVRSVWVHINFVVLKNNEYGQVNFTVLIAKRKTTSPARQKWETRQRPYDHVPLGNYHARGTSALDLDQTVFMVGVGH
jgi:hypothetical protein